MRCSWFVTRPDPSCPDPMRGCPDGSRAQVRHGADVILMGVVRTIASMSPRRPRIEPSREGSGRLRAGPPREQHAAVDDEQSAVVSRTSCCGRSRRGRRGARCAGRWRKRRRAPSSGVGVIIRARPSPPRSCRNAADHLVSVASTSGERTGPPGRPASRNAALVRMTPWVRKNPKNTGSS